MKYLTLTLLLVGCGSIEDHAINPTAAKIQAATYEAKIHKLEALLDLMNQIVIAQSNQIVFTDATLKTCLSQKQSPVDAKKMEEQFLQQIQTTNKVPTLQELIQTMNQQQGANDANN